MERDAARKLLDAVASGAVSPGEALDRLTVAPFTRPESAPPHADPGYLDLGFARVDTHRALRTGDPEVVLAAGKTASQVLGIVAALRSAEPERAALVTRADERVAAELTAAHPYAHADATTVAIGPLPEPRGRIAVITAGTSDAPVAAEAALTARAFGAAVVKITDVGVAGLHRMLAAQPTLDSAQCLVVVAGMEGALPSVVGGLVGTPVVAVPTSVGYGAAFGGVAALLGMLTSCAPGVAVFNIDNGFGAGVFAARVARARTAGTPPAEEAAAAG
ncbi:MAG: nickel pincer cofactor biosynthesis protein LarB [Frankiaceae bacterium]